MEELAKRFKAIIAKYQLDNEERAEAIANYVTTHDQLHFSLEDFCKEFKMEEADAHDFLVFIYKGIEFKETHIDGKKGS